MNFYREILALRVKKKIKLIPVYLYHFSSEKIINHFKHSVRMFLPALHEHEKRQFEKVKEAYLEYKQRYFRHLIKHRETGVRHAIPTEFLSLSYSKGGEPWESFNGDPGWKIIRQEKKLWQDKNLN